MNYNFVMMDSDNTDILFPSYYEYYANLYGESFVSGICRLAIRNGSYGSKALNVLDDAYSKTKETIESSYSEGPCIISVQTPDGKDIAFFRVRFLSIEDMRYACIAEVVLSADLTEGKEEALRDAVGSIEDEIVHNVPEVDAIDFEVGSFDAKLQLALLDLGFKPLGLEDRFSYTYLYEKNLRNKKDSRMRTPAEE